MPTTRNPKKVIRKYSSFGGVCTPPFHHKLSNQVGRFFATKLSSQPQLNMEGPL